MISKTEQSECYVYITLPGQTTAITAGAKQVTTNC